MASFVPRVVQRKGDRKNKKSEPKHIITSQTNRKGNDIRVFDLRSESLVPTDKLADINGERSGSCTDGVDDDHVVSFSKNQRWPEHGEPVCVVCRRYGAYVCNETEQDVCSLECKKMHLQTLTDRRTISINALASSTDPSEQVRSKANQVQHNHESIEFVYREHATISNLTKTQIQQLRMKVEIEVKGEQIVSPILEFFHCPFDERLAINLSSSGYHSPTPVQMQALPVALSGCDVMVCAQTGSGKTAAFLLPMITRIHHITGNLSPKSDRLHYSHGLILAPTRELCMQIEDQAKELMQGMVNMRTALLVGGLPVPPQLHRLQMGVQIIVATPGRLVEILTKYDLDLTHIICCVIDEVDSMLQLGFEHQVQQIIEQLGDAKQTMMFSATIPATIERMAGRLLHNPVYISVGTPSTPTQAVKQVVLWVEEKSKKKHLFSILMDTKHYNPPIVIFVDSKMGADLLAEAVTKVCHISCMAMHGDKQQSERTHILQSFLSGVFPVIVTTGVLGRGVDLLNVKQVINFDMPSTFEEYVHQVGRAGRLGTSGFAITFINNNNKNLFLDIIENLHPLSVTLPSELINSPYAQQQKEHRRQSMKRKENDEIVNQSNLMALLKKRTVKRKRE